MADVLNFVDRALAPKPDLIVHGSDLPATAEALRDLLAASGRFFDRGMPGRIIKPADGGPPSATRLTKHNVVIEAHRLCQPVTSDPRGERKPITLPDRVAQMYLDLAGEWELPPPHRFYLQMEMCAWPTAMTPRPLCGAVTSRCRRCVDPRQCAPVSHRRGVLHVPIRRWIATPGWTPISGPRLLFRRPLAGGGMNDLPIIPIPRGYL
jgi:hypothetical protein